MKLLICEKKLQAEKFAEIFGRHTGKKYKLEKGYFSNGTDINIGFASGHLVELCDPHQYNSEYEKWNIEHLPIIPDPFQLKISNGKNEMFKTLKELCKQADVIYNATDPAREGELIFRYIISKIGTNSLKKDIKFKRLWCNNYEYSTVIDAYDNAKDLTEYNNLYACAKARSESDWLIGINATRMLTLSTNKGKTLSLGRVQTAVLRLIVDRYLANKKFIVQPTYLPYIEMQGLILAFNKTFLEKQEAETLLKNLPSSAHLSKEIKKAKERQPVLFSLVDLQILMSSKANFTASKTLELAQKLYENGFISYPRTDSNYLTNAQKENINTLIDTFKKDTHFLSSMKITNADFLASDAINTHFIFNDSKTSDHFAIIPTHCDIDKANQLDKEAGLVFEEIVKRFTRCFMQEAEVEKTQYFVKINEEDFFKASGKIILSAGHLKLKMKNDENDAEESVLPDIKEGNYTIENKNIQEGKTTPPALFTESSLLKAMKNPLNYEKTEIHNKEVAKELSLGTPATNDKFLPTLVERAYVVFQKKNIVPTDLGISIIEQLKDTKIASIELTLTIEEKLDDIRKGKVSYKDFMYATTVYTKNLMEQIKNTGSKIAENIEIAPAKEHPKCPICKTGNLYLTKTESNYYCSNFKAENPCNFTLYTTQFSKKLTEKQIKDLLSNKKTGLIKGLKSKNGNEFEAHLIFDENFKIKLEFADKKNKK